MPHSPTTPGSFVPALGRGRGRRTSQACGSGGAGNSRAEATPLPPQPAPPLWRRDLLAPTPPPFRRGPPPPPARRRVMGGGSSPRKRRRQDVDMGGEAAHRLDPVRGVVVGDDDFEALARPALPAQALQADRQIVEIVEMRNDDGHERR